MSISSFVTGWDIVQLAKELENQKLRKPQKIKKNPLQTYFENVADTFSAEANKLQQIVHTTNELEPTIIRFLKKKHSRKIQLLVMNWFQ